MLPKEFDFSEIEDLRFECQDQCGICCFTQLVPLTATEINLIANYLKQLRREDFEAFILDWSTAAFKLDKYGEEEFLARKNTLLYFYMPWGYIECEKVLVVRNYLLRSLPSRVQPTGRCVFLNPITFKCFIYPVRPTSCRLYPFTTVKGKLVIALKQCPGIEKGKPIDINYMKKVLTESFSHLKKDAELVKNYIKNQGLKLARVSGKKRRKKITQADIVGIETKWREEYFGEKELWTRPRKKMVDPFIELGVIERTPITDICMQIAENKARITENT